MPRTLTRPSKPAGAPVGRRTAAAAALLATGALLVAGAAPTAAQAVTFGSNQLGALDPSPGGDTCSGSTAPCTFLLDANAGNEMPEASPIDGVVTHFRIATYTPDTVTFRLGQPNGTMAGTGPTVTTFGNGREREVQTHLPVHVGDLVGVDSSSLSAFSSEACGPESGYPGGHTLKYHPTLTDGGPAQAPDSSADCELLVQAVAEPDADGDRFGDDSQDYCPGVAGPVHGCGSRAVVSSGAPDTLVVGATDATVELVGDHYSITDPAGVYTPFDPDVVVPPCTSASPTEVDCTAAGLTRFAGGSLGASLDTLDGLPLDTSLVINSSSFDPIARSSYSGGSRNDFFQGGVEHDIVSGGTGNDTLLLGTGGDPNGPRSGTCSSGDAGNDVIYAEPGNDPCLLGGPGDDLINAGAGNDGVDDNTVAHGGGDDTLIGGDGADVIGAAIGDDFVDGGTGDDTISAWVSGATNGVAQINCGPGTDTVNVGPGDIVASDCEIVYQPTVTCPSGSTCEGTLEVVATPPSSAKASSLAGGSAVASSTQVVLAKTSFRFRRRYQPKARLWRTRVNQVLTGRARVPVVKHFTTHRLGTAKRTAKSTHFKLRRR